MLSELECQLQFDVVLENFGCYVEDFKVYLLKYIIDLGLCLQIIFIFELDFECVCIILGSYFIKVLSKWWV